MKAMRIHRTGAAGLSNGGRLVYSSQFGAYCEARPAKANRVARIPAAPSVPPVG
jgi:hypothetical protein